MERDTKIELAPEEITRFGSALDEILLEIEQLDTRIRRNQSEIRRMKRRGVFRAPRPCKAAA